MGIGSKQESLGVICHPLLKARPENALTSATRSGSRWWKSLDTLTTASVGYPKRPERWSVFRLCWCRTFPMAARWLFRSGNQEAYRNAATAGHAPPRPSGADSIRRL